MPEKPAWPAWRRLALPAALAAALWVLAWPIVGGRAPLHGYGTAFLHTFAASEGAFLLALAVVQPWPLACLAAALASVRSEALPALAARLASPRVHRALAAAVAALAALAVAHLVLRGRALTEDEKTLVYQAKLVLSGRLAVDGVPAEALAFWEPFLVGEGTARWSGQYFWGQPALAALGLLVHAPSLVPALELAVTVACTGGLAHAFSNDARVGLVASLLAATCPALVLTGATLHAVGLAAACGAAALWALVVLARGPSLRAALALGVATGLAAHARPFDHLVLLGGAALVLALHDRRAVAVVAWRALPGVAIALALASLHPLLNRAVSGDALHSGYWMFNDGHGWKTFGFGAGPFGTPHTPAVAAAKTVVSAVRLAFWTTGTPLPWLALAVAAVGASPRRRQLAAPAVVAVVYALAYALYASAGVMTTGPLYYVPLLPVLIGWLALGAVVLHDRLRERAGALARLVPAALVAQTLVACGTFWPSEVAELGRQADDAGRCEQAVADRGIARALVFVLKGDDPDQSAVAWPPMASPDLDDAVLFARHESRAKDAAVVARFAGDRPVYFARCLHAYEPIVGRYDAATGATSDLEGRPIKLPKLRDSGARPAGSADAPPPR